MSGAAQPVWLIVQVGKNDEPGGLRACDDLDTLCPRLTPQDAIAAYSARWPSADMTTRTAVLAEPCDLPGWARFGANHCFRILPNEAQP